MTDLGSTERAALTYAHAPVVLIPVAVDAETEFLRRTVHEASRRAQNELQAQGDEHEVMITSLRQELEAAGYKALRVMEHAELVNISLKSRSAEYDDHAALRSTELRQLSSQAHEELMVMRRKGQEDEAMLLLAAALTAAVGSQGAANEQQAIYSQQPAGVAAAACEAQRLKGQEERLAGDVAFKALQDQRSQEREETEADNESVTQSLLLQLRAAEAREETNHRAQADMMSQFHRAVAAAKPETTNELQLATAEVEARARNEFINKLRGQREKFGRQSTQTAAKQEEQQRQLKILVARQQDRADEYKPTAAPATAEGRRFSRMARSRSRGAAKKQQQ